MSGRARRSTSAAGVKLGLLDKRLNFDLGYIRYVYPSYAADASA